MSTSWYLKHRPTDVKEYIFCDEVLEKNVATWIENEYIPGNVLLYGPPGNGKTTLAEILISKTIKNDFDVRRITSRSVTDLDDVKFWCDRFPIMSSKKILFIEEIDKMSPQAIATLKDTILENFQSTTTCIATTNYINKLENGVKQRFNSQFYLSLNDKKKIERRLERILRTEQRFNDVDKINALIESSNGCSIRELISKLEATSIDKTFIHVEEDIIKTLILIANKLQKNTQITDKEKKAIINTPYSSTIIKEEYDQLNILNNNYANYINHGNIFYTLYERFNYIPLKLLCGKYYEKENIFKEILLLSFYHEFVKIILEC